MLHKIISTTIGISAALMMTLSVAQASEPQEYEVQDCQASPSHTVQCDKIVFHPEEKAIFYCPVETISPARPADTQNPITGVDELKFRHTDLLDIRIKDRTGQINDLRDVVATYLTERGCVRSRPGGPIGREGVVIEHVAFTALPPSDPFGINEKYQDYDSQP